MQRISIIILLAGVFLLQAALHSHAGNKWMMEQNANELIMLNRMLLKRLGTIKEDGTIILSGDVVHEDGKVVIKLYKLQQLDPTGEKDILAPESFDKDLPYQIFLREETLTEIPVNTGKKDK